MAEEQEKTKDIAKEIEALVNIFNSLIEQNKPVGAEKIMIQNIMIFKSAALHDVYSQFLMSKKRYNTGLQQSLKAIEIEPDNINYISNYIICLLFNNDIEIADVYITACMEKYPIDNIFGVFYTCMLVYKNKREDAYVYASKLREKYPNIDIYYNVAAILYQMGKYEDARDYFVKSSKKSPTDSKSMHQIGLCMSMMNKHNEAYVFFKEAFELESDNIIYTEDLRDCMKIRDETTENDLKNNIENKPKDADCKNKLGMFLGDRLRFDEAIEYFKQAIKLEPKNIPLLKNYCTCLIVGKRSYEAEAYCKKLIKLKPKDPIFQDMMANILMCMERYGEALKYNTEAIRLKPDYPNYIFNKACCLINVDRHREGLEYFYKISKAEYYKNDVGYFNYLAMTHMKLLEKEKAEFYFRKIVELRPENEACSFNLACCLLCIDKFEEARDLFMISLKKTPTDPYIYTRLGDCCKGMGDEEQANIYIQNAKDLAFVKDQMKLIPDMKKDFKPIN